MCLLPRQAVSRPTLGSLVESPLPPGDIHIRVTDEDGTSQSITQQSCVAECGSEGGGDEEKMPSLINSESAVEGVNVASGGEGAGSLKVAGSQGNGETPSTEDSNEETESTEDTRLGWVGLVHWAGLVCWAGLVLLLGWVVCVCDQACILGVQ